MTSFLDGVNFLVTTNRLLTAYAKCTWPPGVKFSIPPVQWDILWREDSVTINVSNTSGMVVSGGLSRNNEYVLA